MDEQDALRLLDDNLWLPPTTPGYITDDLARGALQSGPAVRLTMSPLSSRSRAAVLGLVTISFISSVSAKNITRESSKSFHTFT